MNIAFGDGSKMELVGRTAFDRRAVYTLAYGLAGFLAHHSAGADGDGHPRRDWVPDRLLDGILSLALEIPGRGCSCFADCAAPDSLRVLCSGSARATQPVWPMVAIPHRAHARIYF